MAMQSSIVEYGDPRVIGVEMAVCTCNKSLLIVNVYLPYYACQENHESFMYYLSLINSIVSSYKSPYMYVVGDYNGDIKTVVGQTHHSFGK